MAGSTNIAVVDASYVLTYLLPDESNGPVQDTFERYRNGKITLISTTLLPYEVTNGMYAATLTKRVSSAAAKKLIQTFLELPIQYKEVDINHALDLSLKHKISIYDASYLLLARQKHIPFLTLDKKLKKFS